MTLTGTKTEIGPCIYFVCADVIKIGYYTINGGYISFHSQIHNFDRLYMPIRLQGVSYKWIHIGNNRLIGIKVTILDGARNVDNSIIITGPILNEAIYDGYTVYDGMPACKLKLLV